MTDEDTASLTGKKGLGGIIALGGFDYQVWDLMRRIPTWLANPAFEHVIYEGMEDFEARFFAPHAPQAAVLERYQAKQSVLSPGEMKVVFESFKAFEVAHPRTARVQVLVMPGLPPTLPWLTRHMDRVRNARPFYAPFGSLTASNERALNEKLEKEFPEGLGAFIAENVEVSLQVHQDRAHALQAFQTALDAAFPFLDAGAKSARTAFNALETLIRQSAGVPLGRAVLREAIENGIGRSLDLLAAFPLLVRSDRTGRDETRLEIDASAFSGGDQPYPAPDAWSRDLIEPLALTAKWLRSNNWSRIQLSGSYRLTTAMALGWSLRSATGFELDIATKDGYWATDDRPLPHDPTPKWDVRMPARLRDDRLIVSVGVLRDPSTTLTGAFAIPSEEILSMHLPSAIAAAKEVQSCVGLIKRTVDRAIADHRPAGIDLYFAGPAVLAVALGHRWSAMPSTSLHEFASGTAAYVPTAKLG